MKFVVYQCTKDPDYFIVTDEAHKGGVSDRLCPSGGELEAVGEFFEMGARRAAFSEAVAKNAIQKQGYYRFEAPGRAAVPVAPEMPA